MAKVPDYIREKIELMNKFAYRAEELQCEIEDWMESKGCECGFDFIYDYVEPHGYVMFDQEGFVQYVEENL